MMGVYFLSMDIIKFSQAVEEAIKTKGMTPTQFGRAVLKDPGFVFGLRNGRSPTLRTVEKVMQFIEKDAA
jgi:2,4-dienoyl-CoA reductase-like NADH-dependent reductase (Old Yellow Enzyme family)